MCTSLVLHQGGCYFGRNLDLEYSFGEQVVMTPRRFPLHFSQTACPKTSFFHDRNGKRNRRISSLRGGRQ